MFFKESMDKTSEVFDRTRDTVPIGVLGQMPSKQALVQVIQCTRNEQLKAPPNPNDFVNLVIPRFAMHQIRG
jgi:hypothetical protein